MIISLLADAIIEGRKRFLKYLASETVSGELKQEGVTAKTAQQEEKLEVEQTKVEKPEKEPGQKPRRQAKSVSLPKADSPSAKKIKS